MHRNLDNRVEAVLKVEKSELKKYLQFLLSIYLKDNQQRWVLNTDGSYQRVEKKKRTKSCYSQSTDEPYGRQRRAYTDCVGS